MGAQRATQTHRHTETQVNELLAFGVPPKGLKATCLQLEIQMVQCWVEGDGSMLGQKVGSMLGRRGWFDSGLKGMV